MTFQDLTDKIQTSIEEDHVVENPRVNFQPPSGPSGTLVDAVTFQWDPPPLEGSVSYDIILFNHPIDKDALGLPTPEALAEALETVVGLAEQEVTFNCILMHNQRYGLTIRTNIVVNGIPNSDSIIVIEDIIR